MESGDPFAAGAGARLSKTSQHTYLFGWRRFLGFLAIHDPKALKLAASERLTMERVRRFAVHLAETNIPRSVAIQVDALYKAARVMMPEQDWTWLKRVKARLFRAAPSVAPPGPVITSVELLELGQQLMDENMPTPGAPIAMDAAVRYRDGLMIALLAFIPLRRKNLAALEIGRHLVRDNDRWFVVIPRDETKSGAAIEFPVPDILDPYVNLYVRFVRRRMLRKRTCSALWLNTNGDALAYAAIGGIISRHSESGLGFRVTPHDARDAAATTWAVSEPHKIGVARDLLAHADLHTTIRHYNRAKGIEASRAYSQVIAGMRKNWRSS